jgi:hypothetical protein
MEEICAKKKNLYFMNRRAVDIEGTKLRVLGCTLWAKPDPKHFDALEENMTDYKQIGVDQSDLNAASSEAGSASSSSSSSSSSSPQQVDDPTRNYLMPQDVARWHETDVSWLRAEIARAQKDGVWVAIFTHHAPLLRLIPKSKRSTWVRSAYATDLTSLLAPNVFLWAYGHTHIPTDIKVNGTRIVSNPLGYKTQRLLELGHFRPNWSIDLSEVERREFSSKGCVLC